MSEARAMGKRRVVSEQEKDKVVVLDFGGQYSHLIVRRCRELGVYTELLLYDVPIEELRRGIERVEGEGKIRGIILSGSPFGVHEPGSPRCASEIVALEVPLLGICYGAQLLADMLGGVVTTGGRGEFGRTELSISDTDLFEGVSETGKTSVWMSHSDVIERFNGADVIGPNCDAVNRWNPITQQSEGRISLFGGMGTNFAIVPGEGYEVSVTENTTFNLTGVTVTIDPIDLIKKSGSTDKNWIGLPYDTTLTDASSVMDSIGSNCDAVNRWNPDTQAAEGWISLMGGMGTNFHIVTGEGYEVSVTGNTTWAPV